MNKRIFVEKRGIFDVESPKIFDEVKEKGLETKPVQFYIDADLKKRLKTYCVVHDENMTSVLTKVLDTFLVSEGY